MGFSRQEHWSGFSRPPPGDLSDPGIEPATPASPTLQVDSSPLSHQGSLKTKYKKRLKRVWHIYTMEPYSVIEKNEIGLLVEIWTDLQSVIQNEVSQKKNKYHILTHVFGI